MSSLNAFISLSKRDIDAPALQTQSDDQLIPRGKRLRPPVAAVGLWLLTVQLIVDARGVPTVESKGRGGQRAHRNRGRTKRGMVPDLQASPRRIRKFRNCG